MSNGRRYEARKENESLVRYIVYRTTDYSHGIDVGTQQFLCHPVGHLGSGLMHMIPSHNQILNSEQLHLNDAENQRGSVGQGPGALTFIVNNDSKLNANIVRRMYSEIHCNLH